MGKRASSIEITGRDSYIIHQALLYAIAHIQSLPDDNQEWNNMRDMCEIARASIRPDTMLSMLTVKHHTGTLPNLWPDDEHLSGPQLIERGLFRVGLKDLEERLRVFSSAASAATERGEARSIKLRD